MYPKAWKNFRLKEDPEMTIEAVRHHAETGVLVNTVIDGDCEPIIKGLEQALKGIRYTVMGQKVTVMKVRGD